MVTDRTGLHRYDRSRRGGSDPFRLGDRPLFVLKYRLAREQGSTYTVEGTSLSDSQRAIKLVKSKLRNGAWVRRASA